MSSIYDLHLDQALLVLVLAMKRVVPVSCVAAKNRAPTDFAGSMWRARDAGASTAARSRDGLLIVPRQPTLRGFRHGGGVVWRAMR